MTNKEFKSILEKFNEGKCSEEEMLILKKIANSNLRFDDQTFLKSTDESEKLIWEQLSEQIDNENKISTKKYYLIATSIAATILLVASLVLFMNIDEEKVNATQLNRGVETKNNAKSMQKITLPDGSQVILGENARIVVSENFGIKTRTVYLTGEAFFKVKRNEKIPFLVHVGKLITEVLGTSFKISKPTSDKQIEVSVKSGKVSVYSQNDKSSKKSNGVILTPNQKAVFNIQNNTINESIVDTPAILVANTPKSDFVFEDMGVENIMKKMQAIYGIEIILVNYNLNKCVFTGDLSGLSMFQQIEFICSSINSSYEIRGSSIFINGEGCK
ncbi:FecR family protein [Cytophagaceae bacterium 50C-KIRBA]|uniref:FecR family protein n=1 Tax=Aquirufa beregesia TaxID=2516556 RepID=A0ABX0F1R8_9BACT|nr:FecR family protein [Aquirufa beregesia]NGZ44954.1 FecR family protein [Aquirufa beregesia]